jgi:hypothetical protein
MDASRFAGTVNTTQVSRGVSSGICPRLNRLVKIPLGPGNGMKHILASELLPFEGTMGNAFPAS